MQTKPIIGITTQTLEAVPGQLPRCWVMSQRYVNVLVAAGAVPWVIPLVACESALRAIYEQLDGVFLPGGVDLDPSTYGEDPHALCGPVDRDRDRVELTLVRWATADRKPLLAVCRGVQVVNVAFGGALYQDLGAQHDGAMKHDYFPSQGYPRDALTHDVRIVPGTRLAEVLGAPAVRVNSMHHQGIRALAPGLVANAFAPDALTEGVEAPDQPFLLGVQWHPEELADRDSAMARLFSAFLTASRQVLPQEP